jgi:DNA-binding SARP family transcriptional activator/tetratricopeptide (TPR) repeat protein
LPAKLQLRLLGTFEARLNGVPLERFRSAKVRALLAYLAVEADRTHLREALATLLWGEYPEANAQQSLSQALTNLRGLLATLAVPGNPSDPLLSITGQSVQLHPDPERLWVDIHAFDSLLAAADPQRSSALEEIDLADPLEEAVALYQGPFLAGLSLPDSREFEEWLMLHREQRHQAMMLALERLVRRHLAEGRTELVRPYARRQLSLEPWSESGHQALMLALALQGQRGAALQQYEACRRVLAEELGVEPSAATEVLVRQIREGIPSQAMLASNPPPAPFVARERELTRLEQSLARALAGQGRVILVTGEAGTGKTALLEHFARRAQEIHHWLVVAGGRCGAYAGLGDPFLPFREILHALIGETEGVWSGGTGDPEHARRQMALFPQATEALLARGPDLIGRLISVETLAARAETLAPPDAPWRDRLAEHLERSRLSSPGKTSRRTEPLQQEALFGQVTRVLQAIARKQPLLLLIDDLQWADVTSLSLLFHLGRRLAGCRILVVCAYRPSEIAPPSVPPPRKGSRARRPRQQAEDERPPLEAIIHEFGRLWGDIRIDLDQADSGRFVDALLDGEPNGLGEGFRDRLIRHTGGHALFTIELLLAFQERGDLRRDEQGRWVEGPDLRWEGLPPRVEAVIAERVGRLPRGGRRLLEAASVEGESFSAEVAARALGTEPAWALQWLGGRLSGDSRLVQAMGVQSLPAGGRPLSRYRFAHALFQEYLYGHLDAVDRAHLHGEVGTALEGLCRADEVALARASPQLARHFEEAGQVLKAARYRLEAGRWAAKLAAYDEAIAHLERGLALLEGAAASRERLRLELGLCTAISTPAMLQRGWQAPAYTQALERLSDLIQHPELQDDPQRLTALTVLALSTGWSDDPERSGRVGEQLLGLASSSGSGQAPSSGSGQAPTVASGQAQEGDRQPLMLGHWALGFSYWVRGQPVPAREHLDRAVALYDPGANRPLGGLVAADPGVMARAMLGAVLWQMGYPDQARACFRQAVAHAEALGQPSSVAFAHYIAVMITSVVGRDLAAALNHRQALPPLGQLNLVYGAWAEVLEALAQTSAEAPGQAPAGQRGDCPGKPRLDQGVARAIEALSTWQSAGSGAGYAGLLVLQAEVCARAGKPEIGLDAMDRAQAWIERTGRRPMEADIWRMRGELLLLVDDRPLTMDNTQAASPAAEAEACFQRALEIAREQGSRWWELRAAVCLARLWRAQGRRDDARELLAGIYGWFTEGFGTADLVEAKALLGELQ